MGLTLTSLPYQLSRPHRPGICMPLSFFLSFLFTLFFFLFHKNSCPNYTGTAPFAIVELLMKKLNHIL